MSVKGVVRSQSLGKKLYSSVTTRGDRELEGGGSSIYYCAGGGSGSSSSSCSCSCSCSTRVKKYRDSE